MLWILPYSLTLFNPFLQLFIVFIPLFSLAKQHFRHKFIFYVTTRQRRPFSISCSPGQIHVLRGALRGRLTAEVTALGKIKIRLPAVLLALVLLFPAQAAAVREVIPIGHTAGIRMKSEGVLVVRLDEVESADGAQCPAREAGLREGDIIVSRRRAGGRVERRAPVPCFAAADGGAVALGVLRGR